MWIPQGLEKKTRGIWLLIFIPLCLQVYYKFKYSTQDMELKILKNNRRPEAQKIWENPTRKINSIIPKTYYTMMTARNEGRLGNQMYFYALLYATARYNHRPAFMSPLMSKYLTKYFNLTLPSLTRKIYKRTKWKVQYLTQEIPPNIKSLTGRYIKLYRYTHNLHYFDEFRYTIRHDFKFLPWIEEKSKNKINEVKKLFLNSTDIPVSVIGVHVRGGDWIGHSQLLHYFIPTVGYYVSAMKYFKDKYSSVIFIVSSNGMEWCKENFKDLPYSIYYLEGTSEEDGGYDMSVLTLCDHIIIGAGFGTFSFFSAYLNRNGGDVIYCEECFPNQTLTPHNKADMVLPEWKAIPMHGLKEIYHLI